MSSAPSFASLSAPEASTLVPAVGSAAQNSHATTALSSSLRRKYQRNAVAKASKHSPLLKDLKIRSMMRNFNLNTPASSTALTELFGGAGEDFFSGSTSIPPTLESPQSFRSVERICKLVQQYINGSFDARIWPLIPEHSGGVMKSRGRADMQGRGSDAMNMFYSLHVAAHRLLQSPNSDCLSHAYDLINKAYDQFRPMIVQCHHNTLLQLFSVIVLFESRGPAFDFRLNGLKFFLEMATTILGQHHHITAIIAVIPTVEESAITYTIAQAWEALAASFEQNLGVTHHVSLNCRLKMIESIYVNSSKFQEAELLLRKLFDTAVAARGPKDIQSASIEYSLAKILLHETQPVKCAEIAYSGIERCQDAPSEDEYAAAALESSAYQLVATAYGQMGHHVAAESCLRRYVQIRVSKWGSQSPIALHALHSLEEFLTAVQKQDEAALIKQQRLSLMNQL